MDTTTRLGLKTNLARPEPVNEVKAAINNNADVLEAIMATAIHGTLAARPSAASRAQQFYLVNSGASVGLLSYSDGSAWWDINVQAVDGPPNVGTNRTLGHGPNQAMPGDDPSRTDTRVSPDNTVTLSQLIAALKPGGAGGSAAAGDYAVRKLGTGASDALPGNTTLARTHRHIHPFTIQGPNAWAAANGDEVGRFEVRMGTSEAARLLFGSHFLAAKTGVDSVFKFQRYHSGAWGDLTIVGGGTNFSPSATTPNQTDLDDVDLSIGDWIRLICVTVGTGKGGGIGVAIDYTF